MSRSILGYKQYNKFLIGGELSEEEGQENIWKSTPTDIEARLDTKVCKP